MEKLEAKIAVHSHGFEKEYQSYFAEIELLEPTTDNLLDWETFFMKLNSSKYNVAKITIERVEEE